MSVRPLWGRLVKRLRPWADADLRALDQRLVVFDLETTGLDTRRDRPLSIGAIAIDGGRVSLDDAFHAELQPGGRLAADNVLVHRLTPERLARGEHVAVALRRFLDYVGDAPLLAYHAGFDRSILRHALRRELGLKITPLCLDVAPWARQLTPEIGSRPPSLDAVLAYYRIVVSQRHDALHDALATAQLVLLLLARSRRQGIHTIGELRHFLSLGEALHRLQART